MTDVALPGLPMPQVSVQTYKNAKDMQYYITENAKRGWVVINTLPLKHSYPLWLILLTGFLCFLFQPPTDYVVTYRWMPDTLIWKKHA